MDKSRLRYRVIVRYGLIVLVVLAGAGCGTVDLESSEVNEPSASLGPAEVVSAQLRALGGRNAADEGVETAYRFFSPRYRDTTGSLEDFRSRFDDSPYESMLGHREAEVFGATVHGGLAVVPVSLIDDEGRDVDYVFVLTRQREEEYENMWMTDSVQIHSPDDPDSEMR